MSEADSQLSWSGWEQDHSKAGGLSWSLTAVSTCVISEEFRCYYSTSFSSYIRFIILCQSYFAVSFLFCEQAFVSSVCITVIYINSQ